MLKWLFKPVKKIGAEDLLETLKEEPPVVDNIAEEILNVGDIDKMCSDIVMSRVLLCLHTDSIEQLFDCMTAQKDVLTQTQTAVALGLYFRGMRIPPSECMIRLSKYIESGKRVPSKINEDLKTLRDELIRLKSI